MTVKRIAFHHFGCKVNFSEASAISRKFREEGYQIVDCHKVADIYVISTCMVTGVAEKKCRAAIRQAHALNPEAQIAVIGCFSELNSQEIGKMEGVTLVLGNAEKANLFERIEASFNPGPALRESCTSSSECVMDAPFSPSYSCGDRTRSFLKIQDGCDYYCSYCTIPYARGHSRSDTIDHVVRSVQEIKDLGVKEIVLTGINIGDFGRSSGETLQALLENIAVLPGLPRIRVSSIEPDLLTDGIIGIIAGGGPFMPHFHIPLQSGSDRILKIMKRRYTTDLFRERVARIRSFLPLACIAVDVIAGFPGESEDDFGRTFSFLDSLPVSYMHVFSYSRRERTMAAMLEGVLPARTLKERSNLLHRLSEVKKQAFYHSNSGREAKVLFESDQSEGWMHGFTENYCKTRTLYNPELANTVQTVKLATPESGCIFTV